LSHFGAEVILPRLFAQLFAAQHLASAATKIRIFTGESGGRPMRRMQTALVFWSFLSLSMFMIAIRANADGLSFDLSLIGYDDRGTLQSQNNAQAQPCQSCPPGTNCQSCDTDETCTCNSADHQCGSAAAPMILNIGPPPKLYSPASDFGDRVAAKPSGLSVVGDDGDATAAVQVAAPTRTIYTVPCGALMSYPSPTPNAAMAVYTAPVAAPAFAAAGFPTAGMTAVAQPPCVPAVGCPGYPPASFAPPATMYYVPAAPSSNAVAGTTAGQLDHMLQAIHHLEAAGLQAEADRLRGLCDAQMHEAVNQLRSAEAELLQLRETATAETSAVKTNHPLQPVVTAALVPVPKSSTHYYPVQQAGYISPSETLTQPEHQDYSFDQTASPLPFSPQLISVGPLQGFGFGEFSNTWKTLPEVELPTLPWILEGSLGAPDYR
jgi:hypothetical protein